MTIQVDTTKQALAQTYTGLGQFFGLATNPPTPTATNEASGTDYTRVPAGWTNTTPGVYTASPTIPADAGTYTYAILCKSGTAGQADITDYCAIGNQTVNQSPGKIKLSANFTQT